MNRVLIVVWGIAAAAAFAQQSQPPDKRAAVQQVFAAWKARRTMVKSVRYVVSGEVVIPRESIINDRDGNPRLPEFVPVTDLAGPCRATMLVDLAGGRYRLEKEEKVYSIATNTLESRVTLALFDGKEFWQANRRGPGAPPSGSPDAYVMTGNLREAAFIPEDWPFFIAHGFVPTHENHILPGRFDPKVMESEFYEYGRAKHAGSVCVVLRTEVDHFTAKTVNEYWVDVARTGAVVRQVVYVSGAPTTDIDLRYVKTQAGWLLGGGTVTHRDRRKTRRIMKFHVDSCEPDVATSQADYRVELRPGMKVKRIDRGGTDESIAPAPTVSDQTFIVGASGTMTQTGGTPARSGRTWWWILAGVLALLVGGVWRIRRNAA